MKAGLEHRLNRWFQEQSNAVGKVIKSKYKIRKAAAGNGSNPDGDDLQYEVLVGGKRIPKIQSDLIRAMVLLSWGAVDWKGLAAMFQPYLEDAGKEGVDVGVGQVQMTDAGKRQDAANDEAEEYAARRSAELAGMKRNAKGELEEDPDAHWPLTEVVKQEIRNSITLAVTEGWTTEQLAAVIDASYALSAERAAVVADNEITNAQSAGTYSLWRQSGTITLVQWVTADVDRQFDECDMYEAQGVVPLGHEFAEGLFSPRAHPRCQCELEVVDPDDLQQMS